MKYIWYREEKWEFVKWLCRAKDDRWLLVKKKTNCITDNGHECYEWATIDCGNDEWLWSNKENDKLYTDLAKANEQFGKANRKITDRWCGIERLTNNHS